MIRIALTGPESSGKTTLGIALSDHLEGTFFPEYARTYLENLDREYTQADLDFICEGHLSQFEQSQDEIQLVDSDFIVLKVWSEVKYESVSERISSAVEANHFDLHILCVPDIPWEYDPQREHPNQREELFELYKQELIRSKKDFIIVSGSMEDRIRKSCETIAAIQN